MPSTRGGRADRHCRGWTPVYTSKGRAGVIGITITRFVRICIKTRLELSELDIVRALAGGIEQVQPFLELAFIQDPASILTGASIPSAQRIEQEMSKGV